MKKSKLLSYISFATLYLIAPDVFAGPFTPLPGDESIILLGTIFGSNVGTIFLGGSPAPILTAIFNQFNIVIVSIATIVISYIGVVSTINTAQEGQAMGKKWSSIWLPMRSMIGMLLMVPTPGAGYSMIQVTVMWLIVQGVGAADQIWTSVLTLVGQGFTNGTPNVDLSTVQTQAKELVTKSLINSAVCLESIRTVGNQDADAVTDGASPVIKSSFHNLYDGQIGAYTLDDPAPPTVTASTTSVTYSGHFNVGIARPTGTDAAAYQTLCGGYNISATVQASDLSALNLTGRDLANAIQQQAEVAYNQKKNAMIAAFNVLSPIAQDIVHGRVRPLSSNSTTNGLSHGLPTTTPLPSFSPSGYIRQASDAYTGAIAGLLQPAPGPEDKVRAGIQAGWIVAGSYYFILNSASNQNLLATANTAPTVATAPPSCPSSTTACTGPTYTTVPTLNTFFDYIDSRTEQTFIAQRLADADLYQQSDAGASNTPSLSAIGIGGGAAGILAPLQYFAQSAVQTMTTLMNSSRGDPLLSHAQFGGRLMITVEMFYLALTATALLIASGVGICSAQSPGGLMWTTTLLSVMPPIAAVLGALWTCGASFSLYLPMVPYMIYAVAAIGWFILVIEAIIAAPLIALGMVVPSGDELGKVTHGLMILVGIMLRPTLMVFGFILSARLFTAAVQLVDFGMADTIGTLNITGSLFSPVVIMGLYASFVTALANKCFALIYLVPDKIMRWMGGGHDQTDASALQETQRSTDKAAEGMKGAVSGAAAGSSKKAQDATEKRVKDKAEADKATAAGAKAAHSEMMQKEANAAKASGGKGGGAGGGGEGAGGKASGSGEGGAASSGGEGAGKGGGKASGGEGAGKGGGGGGEV